MPQLDQNLHFEERLCGECHKIEKYLSSLKIIEEHENEYQDFVDSYNAFIKSFQLQYNEFYRLRRHCFLANTSLLFKFLITFPIIVCTFKNVPYENQKYVISLVVFLLIFSALEIVSFCTSRKHKYMDSVKDYLLNWNLIIKRFNWQFDKIKAKFELEEKFVGLQNDFRVFLEPFQSTGIKSLFLIFYNPFGIIYAMQLSYVSYAIYQEHAYFAASLLIGWILIAVAICVYILQAITKFKKISYRLKLLIEDFAFWFEDMCILRVIVKKSGCSDFLHSIKPKKQDFNFVLDSQSLSDTIFAVYMCKIEKSIENFENKNNCLHFLLCERNHEVDLTAQNINAEHFHSEVPSGDSQEIIVTEEENLWNESAVQCSTKNQNKQRNERFYPEGSSEDSQKITVAEKDLCNESSLQRSTENQKEKHISNKFMEITEIKNDELRIFGVSETESYREKTATPLDFDENTKTELCINQKRCSDVSYTQKIPDRNKMSYFTISQMDKSIQCSLDCFNSLVGKKGETPKTDSKENTCRDDLNKIHGNVNGVEIISNIGKESTQTDFIIESKGNVISARVARNSVENYEHPNKETVMKYVIENFNANSTTRENDINGNINSQGEPYDEKIKTIVKKETEPSEQEHICSSTLPRQTRNYDILKGGNNMQTEHFETDLVNFEINWLICGEKDYKLRVEKMFGNETCAYEWDFYRENAESADFNSAESDEVQQNETVSDSCSVELGTEDLIIRKQEIKKNIMKGNIIKTKENKNIMKGNIIKTKENEEVHEFTSIEEDEAQVKETDLYDGVEKISKNFVVNESACIDSKKSVIEGHFKNLSENDEAQESEIEFISSEDAYENNMSPELHDKTNEGSNITLLGSYNDKYASFMNCFAEKEMEVLNNKNNKMQTYADKCVSNNKNIFRSTNRKMKFPTKKYNNKRFSFKSFKIKNRSNPQTQHISELLKSRRRNTKLKNCNGNKSQRTKDQEIEEQVSFSNELSIVNTEEHSTILLSTENENKGVQEQVTSNALLNTEVENKEGKEEATSAVLLNAEKGNRGVNEQVTSPLLLNTEDEKKGVKEQVRSNVLPNTEDANKEVQEQETSTSSTNKEDENKGRKVEAASAVSLNAEKGNRGVNEQVTSPLLLNTEDEKKGVKEQITSNVLPNTEDENKEVQKQETSTSSTNKEDENKGGKDEATSAVSLNAEKENRGVNEPVTSPFLLNRKDEKKGVKEQVTSNVLPNTKDENKEVQEQETSTSSTNKEDKNKGGNEQVTSKHFPPNHEENTSINFVEQMSQKQGTVKETPSTEDLLNCSQETKNVEKTSARKLYSSVFSVLGKNEKYPPKRKLILKQKVQRILHNERKSENTCSIELKASNTEMDEIIKQFQGLQLKITPKNLKRKVIKVDLDDCNVEKEYMTGEKDTASSQFVPGLHSKNNDSTSATMEIGNLTLSLSGTMSGDLKNENPCPLFGNPESEMEQAVDLKVEQFENNSSILESSSVKNTKAVAENLETISTQGLNFGKANTKLKLYDSNKNHQFRDSQNDSVIFNSDLKFDFSVQRSSNEENQVFLFGKAEKESLLPKSIRSPAVNEMTETISNKKESIFTFNGQKNGIQSITQPFSRDKINKTAVNDKNTNNFTFNQISKEHSTCLSLSYINKTNEIFHGQRNRNILISDNGESKMPGISSSPAVNMVFNTVSHERHNIAPIWNPPLIQENINNVSIPENVFEVSKIPTTLSTPPVIQEKISDFIASVPGNAFKFNKNGIDLFNTNPPADKTNQYTLNELAKSADGTCKQFFLNTDDTKLNKEDTKNAENFAENLTMKRHGTFSDKIPSTPNYFNSFNEKIFNSFPNEIIDNETLHSPQVNAVSAVDIAPHRSFSPNEVLNSISSEVSKHKDTSSVQYPNVGIASSSDAQQEQIKRVIPEYQGHNKGIISSSDVEQKQNKQVTQEYQQTVFAYSSEDRNHENHVLGCNSCNNAITPASETIRKAYRSNRRRINFSDSTEDEIHIDCGRKRLLSSDTLQRSGYFLSVRKTKYFCLSIKAESTPTVNKHQLHVHNLFNNQDTNKCCFRNDYDQHSFTAKNFPEKPKHTKKKDFKMKLISSENKREKLRPEASCVNKQSVEGTQKKQKQVRPKIKKERLSVETDRQTSGEHEKLNLTIKNYSDKISKPGSENVRLESNISDIDDNSWISSNSCIEEDILNSSLAGGTSEDVNFHFHESTDTSSAGEFTSEYNSKSGKTARIISKNSSYDSSEMYDTRSESNTSTTSIVEKAEKSTTVSTISFGGGSETVRDFVSNAEQREIVVDGYVIGPEKIMRNANSKVYHLKHENVNLKFLDDPTSYVTLRLISENESEQSGSHSKKKRNSEHFLTVKELRSTMFEKVSSYSTLNSDDTSIDTVSSDAKDLVKKKRDGMDEEAASSTIRNGTPSNTETSSIRKGKTVDTESLKFYFRPEKGITEVKFRRMPDASYLQYKTEKTKLYFKKKYF